MKKGLILALCFGLLFAGVAIAGPPDISGEWSGEGQIIFPDGTIIPDGIPGQVSIDAVIYQEGSLIWGTITASVPSFDPQILVISGAISDNGTIRANFRDAVGDPFGVFDAKYMGNKIEGTARDFSDVSTLYSTVTRVKD
jgi:hypothetical protein